MLNLTTSPQQISHTSPTSLRQVAYVVDILYITSPYNVMTHYLPYCTLVDSFNMVVQLVKQDLLNKHPSMIEADKRVMVALWYLANKEGFRCISQRFGISVSTAHQCLYDVTNSLVGHLQQFIKFPTDYQATSNSFYKFGYPNVCGALDGTLINIMPPAINKADYITRKNTCAINLTAVCDAKKRYTSVFVGYSGKCHDAHIFSCSPLYRMIMTEQLIPNQYHLLADAAYGLHHNIISPYANKVSAPLSMAQTIHNKRHSSTRMVIERSFGDLKGRWRRLNSLENHLQNVCNIITACTVLHNICLNNADVYDSETDTFHRSAEDEHYHCDVVLPVEAKAKRDAITRHIMLRH